MSPHQAPMKHAELLTKIRAADLKLPVVVKGQYSPDQTKAERTLVYSEHGNRLIKVLDAWLTPETYQELIAAFPTSASPRTGSCSAMYSTKPKYVWAVCENELRLWHSLALVARFSVHKCQLRRRFISNWSEYPCSRFAFVHAFISATWLRREVTLESKDGQNTLVARNIDLMPIVSATYDGMDVMCDTSWARDLAESISNATAIPLKLNELL